MEKSKDTLISFGGAIKNLGGGKIGGLLVRFGDVDNTDFYEDFYTKDTNFGSAKTSPILWQHSMDPVIGDIELGEVTLKKTDFGIFAEGVLKIREEYEAFLEEEFGEGGAEKFINFTANMIEAQKMGWSAARYRTESSAGPSLIPPRAKSRHTKF
ncbi:MAG: hypothetical protein IIB38_08875 [Candidatus Hydrogenedentes bacterium]|nr:hypothetical protein [Candidatus Hydrogenedentota bacterium]